MQNKKTVLITGVTGFLGSHLFIALVNSGHNVVAYKRKTSDLSRLEAQLCRRVSWFDIEDGVHKPFDGHAFDFVIHAATSYGRKNEDILEMLNCNLLFPLNVFNVAKSHHVPCFINTDTSLDKFVSDYALSKKQFMEWLQFSSDDIKVINICLEHFYGPNNVATNFIENLISVCKRNDKEIALTKGEQIRDFIYIDDVVSACLLVMKNTNRFKEHFTNISLGSGNGVKIRDLCELIKQKTNSKTNLLFGKLNYRKNEPMLSVADISVLQGLGWSPKYSLERGLDEAISWG